MRTLLRLLLCLPLFYLVYLNYQLYYEPQMAIVAGRPINQDLLGQLRFLKTRMHQGAAEDMQQLYPEGFVYLNALYGLSWVELAGSLPESSALRYEALAESSWAVRAILSPTGRVLFEEDLPLPYGAYYRGWSTYLLGRYLTAQTPAERTAADVRLFRQNCTQIAQALSASPTPYLESYTGAAWPADGMMCLAALACHDRVLPPLYQPTIQQWLTVVDTRLDSLGMIPHKTDARTGEVTQAALGASQSQLLNFLYEVDSTYARRHFRLYRHHFLTSRFGLPGMRESPQEADNAEHIDSGPVLLDIGGAASIVGRRIMQRYGDTVTAVGLRNSIEAFGMPFQINGQKRYLFGQLPIADAFIAWSNSLEVNHTMDAPSWSRIHFHGLSTLLALGLLIALYMLRRRPVS
ncbi:hypothetical protein [Hymenobacter volaticus]|uniref:D-glucuronyl C5-epimerase C-terminal domain-containing protein n=1 Tax=Hymenobacter volaticus TaxID=2932254 RepID=A0ABY4G3F0_9BACT|nr:hypothetical protein [Hymenobacter volaticus]UOQ65383.1 hypothetical protein MUN86_17775 [Hymenobacter volaticus]